MVILHPRPTRRPRANGPWMAWAVTFLLLAVALLTTFSGMGTAPATGLHARAALAQPPPPPYPVNFTESGLPGGTMWSVTLGGSQMSSPGNEIQFLEQNGTYSFTVGTIVGWCATPSTGSVTVFGDYPTESISWSSCSFTLTFQESGLEIPNEWSVTVNGVPQGPTEAPSLSFTLPAYSSYNYLVTSSNSSWAPSPSSGSGTLNNGLTVPVTFFLVAYHVKFSETGLPLNTQWTVSGVAGEPPASSMTSTISLPNPLPNGSYSYSVSSSNPSYIASGGSFTVSGEAEDVPVAFTVPGYPVEFTRSGLPTGQLWNVTLNGVLEANTTNNIIFTEPDGSYSFVVGPIPGYIASPRTGTISVSGAPPPITQITWTRVLYNVTFDESGFTGSTKWWVNLTGTTNTSHPGNSGLGTTIVISLPNGTYPYTIASDDKRWEPNLHQGTFVVNGRDLEFNVTFVELFEAVTFTEANLPPGAEWWANVSGGVSGTSNGTTIAYPLANGTYTYHIQALNRNWAAPGGNFTVDGAPVEIAVNFTDFLYSVTFNETGLATGTTWSVTLDNVTNSSTGTSISFREPNGTAAYQVGLLPGYTVRPEYNNVTVRGKPVYVAITFKGVAYPVTVNETGLPPSTNWWVNVSWSNHTLVGSFLFVKSTGTISLSNGSYSYSASTSDKSLTPQLGTGNFTIAAGALIVNGVVQTDLTVNFIGSAYPVTFYAKGLPPGADWSVTLTNAQNFNGLTESSTTDAVVFGVENGSFNFTVPLYGAYSPSPVSGGGSVNGAGTSFQITFVLGVYQIVFAESGLAGGTGWSVTLDGLTMQSTTSTLVFSVATGTYPYSVMSSGGLTPSPASGWVTVSGNTTMAVAFGLSNGNGGGLSGVQLALLGGLIGAGAILLAAVFLSRRSRREPPSEFTVPPAGANPGPPGGNVAASEAVPGSTSPSGSTSSTVSSSNPR